MKRRSFLGALAAAPLLASCGLAPGSAPNAAAQAAGSGRFAVGLMPVAHFATVYIAQQEGLFRREGLTITTQVIQNAASMVPSVLNGQLAIGSAAGAPFLNAVARNVPTRAVAPATALPRNDAEDTIGIVVAADGPQTLGDLAGKTLATNAQGSQPHIAACKVLLDAGIDPDGVRVVAMPMPDQIAALQQGRVAAAALGEPFVTIAVGQGARILSPLYAPAFPGPGVESVFFSAQEIIDARREELTAFGRCVIEANTLANEDRTLLEAILVRELNMEPELAREMVVPRFATDLDPEALVGISDVMTETGFLLEPVAADRLVFA